MNNRFHIREFHIVKGYKKKRTFWDIVFLRNQTPMFHYNVRFEFSGQVLKPGYKFIIEGGTKFMVNYTERLSTLNRDVNVSEAMTVDMTIDDLKKMEKPEYGIVTSKVSEQN
jgi:hypothetical protein